MILYAPILFALDKLHTVDCPEMLYDVIICGAGPAGSTCAKHIAEQGYSVALLDKQKFPRNKPCGGALRLCIDKYDFITENFKKIPMNKSSQVKMFSPNKKYCATYQSKKGLIYHIDRYDFDYQLANDAVDAGATFFEKNYIRSIRISENKTVIFLTNGQELQSKLVVGAGGMFDPIAVYVKKKHGLHPFWRKSQMAYMIMQEIPTDESFITSVFSEKHTSYMFLKPQGMFGYGWVFPKISTINLGVGASLFDFRKWGKDIVFSQYMKYLKKLGLLPEKYSADQKVCMLPISGPLKKTFSDRVLLVGDAAGFIFPLTGDGIYYAVSSGCFAADTASMALETERFDDTILHRYQTIWERRWGFEIRLLNFMTHFFQNDADRFIKYLCYDEKLRQYMQQILTGRKKIMELVPWMLPRLMVDFCKYEAVS